METDPYITIDWEFLFDVPGCNFSSAEEEKRRCYREFVRDHLCWIPWLCITGVLRNGPRLSVYASVHGRFPEGELITRSGRPAADFLSAGFEVQNEGNLEWTMEALQERLEGLEREARIVFRNKICRG